MACICGCDEDNHLHSLPSRPASPNTFFEDFWAPSFVEVLMYRLQTVLNELEPSKRILWRQEYGGDAQDTVHPFHKWANVPKYSDESRGCGIPTPTLPTPNFEDIMKEEQMVQEELIHDQHRNSGNSRVAQKRPSPSNEANHPPWTHTLAGDAHNTAPPWHKWSRPLMLLDESRGCELLISKLPTPDYEDIMRKEQMVEEELMKRRLRYSDNTGVVPKRSSPSNEEEEPQTSLPPAKSVTHNSSVWSEESITSPSSPKDLNQPVLDSSIKLASQNLPFWYDHGDTVSCTPPLHRQHDGPGNEFAVERSHCRSPASQASRDSPWIKQEARGSTKRKAEAADLEDRFNTQKVFSSASTPNRCPCGCGEDAVHCLWLNVPPPPKTFFEYPLAPKITYMLDTRLEDAAMRFEASRQTWRRPECGGCAPDRKRSASEIRTEKSDDGENVLKTGPLPFDDVSKIRGKTIFQSTRNFQRSTRSLSAPIRSLDGLAKTPHFSRKSSPLLKREDLTVKKRQQLEQSCMHKLEPMRVEKRCQVGVPLKRGRPLLAENPSLTFQGDNIKNAPSSIKAMSEESCTEDLQDWNQSTSPKTKAMILRRNSWHGTASERHDSLNTDFSPSTSHDLHVEEIPPNVKDLTKNVAPDQRQQSLYQKIKVLKLRRNRRQGVALYRYSDPAVETSSSALQVDHVEEISWIERNESTTDETQRLQQLSEKIP